MSIESTQVNLRLTTNKSLLKEARRRKAIKQDAKGDKIVLQFDGQTFEFRPGVKITVGASIAKELIKRSQVIVGDDLTGDLAPLLETFGKFEIGEAAADEQEKLTVCQVCKKDCFSLSRLSRHLMVAHTKDRPDLYEDKPKPEKPATDWDTPIEDEPEPKNVIEFDEDDSGYDTTSEEVEEAASESGDVR